MSQESKIQELYNSGMSMKKISIQLEISYKDVRDAINNEKVLEFSEKKDNSKVPEVEATVSRKKSLEIFEKKKTSATSPGISAIVR